MNQIKIDGIKKLTDALPYGTAADELISWMQLHNLFSTNYIKTSQDHLKKLALRVAAIHAHYFLAPMFIYYNLHAAGAHLLLGVVLQKQSIPQTHTYKEIRAVFLHVMSAAYDLTISYFFKTPRIGLLLKIGVAFYPIQLQSLHQKIFQKGYHVTGFEDNLVEIDHHNFGECWIKEYSQRFCEFVFPS